MTHYNPFPTDAEIDAIAMAHAEEMRQKLTADREAALAAAFEAIEQQMTDADKADEARPAGFTITVAGAQASGKTTLLMLLLDALADAGVMTGPATKAFTDDPCRFLYNSFEANEGHYESINIDLDLASLIAEKTQPAVERLIGKLSYDAALAGITSPETFKMWIINVVSEMVDRSFAERGQMMPMMLEIEPV